MTKVQEEWAFTMYDWKLYTNNAATTSPTSLMYHLRNSHNIELINNSKPDDDQSDDSLDTSNHKTRMPTNKTKYRHAETNQWFINQVYSDGLTSFQYCYKSAIFRSDLWVESKICGSRQQNYKGYNK